MLQDMLSKADEDLGSDELCLGSVGADSLNKENELHQRWLQLPTTECHLMCLELINLPHFNNQSRLIISIELIYIV
ncbi:hypothetical protein CEXT_101251 [Caerostris extrusa]|uniref:Uncharacterized protein n=1 Tax=Caerostris extrusa TaxID=172846 RepID=A0AAV4U264_CAEEX|nr:hypothetical protein CEXT_101251 [Caerostris extrusa]